LLLGFFLTRAPLKFRVPGYTRLAAIQIQGIPMGLIQSLATFKFNVQIVPAQSKATNVLSSRDRQKVFEIKLSNSEKIARHAASSPITVLCLGGDGVFRAGEGLEEEQRLTAGTLIALDADIAHEVCAEPALHILVTKF
jgi:quercetin dioxygenase-like cupin family protein